MQLSIFRCNTITFIVNSLLRLQLFPFELCIPIAGTLMHFLTPEYVFVPRFLKSRVYGLSTCILASHVTVLQGLYSYSFLSCNTLHYTKLRIFLSFLYTWNIFSLPVPWYRLLYTCSYTDMYFRQILIWPSTSRVFHMCAPFISWPSWQSVCLNWPALTCLVPVNFSRHTFDWHVWHVTSIPRVFYFPATRVSLSDHVWPEPCNCVSSPITRSTPDAKRKKSVVLFCADLFFCNGILHKERRRMRRWWFKEFAFHLY